MKITAPHRPVSSVVGFTPTPVAQQPLALQHSSFFEAPQRRVGPALTVPAPGLTVLTDAQRSELELRRAGLEASLRDVNQALARADAGQPLFGALRESLENLPAMLTYEIARTKRLLDGVPTDDIAMTPFVQKELQTAHDCLVETDWYTLSREDHGIAEGLDWSLRTALSQVPRLELLSAHAAAPA